MQDERKKQDSTHFGYQTVDWSEKQERVADVFHSVASNYDLMNDVMSMGVHRIWKRFTIELAAVSAGQKVLDLAGGTGDLASRFAQQVGDSGQVILSDINDSMLRQGRTRLIDKGLAGNLDYAQANAEALPFADNYFDCITIAFGLRNVTDQDAALSEMYRVLKPGGRLLVLEFSKPVVPGLGKLYDLYSFSLLPKLGKWIARDEKSYRYLAESIRMHPDQQTLKAMALDAGFDSCDVYNLTGGIVALHRAFKF